MTENNVFFLLLYPVDIKNEREYRKSTESGFRIVLNDSLDAARGRHQPALFILVAGPQIVRGSGHVWDLKIPQKYPWDPPKNGEQKGKKETVGRWRRRELSRKLSCKISQQQTHSKNSHEEEIGENIIYIIIRHLGPARTNSKYFKVALYWWKYIHSREATSPKPNRVRSLASNNLFYFQRHRGFKNKLEIDEDGWYCL